MRVTLFPDARREQMAGELLARGSATMREIMEASFGEWPPKGLDIKEGHFSDQPINFSKSGNRAILAQVRAGQENRMEVSERFYEEGVVMAAFGLGVNYAIIGHEGTHLLQYAGKFCWSDADAIMTALTSEDLWTRDDAAREKSISHIRERAMNYALYFDAPGAGTRHHAGERLHYYQKGCEFQARLHETLAAGYPHWGRLPQDREELFMALRSFGLKPLAEVEQHLQSLPPQHPARGFSLKTQRKTRASEEMRVAYEALSPAAREKFWQETLPMLYANLIELYGDKQGRARLGLETLEPVKREIKSISRGKASVPSSGSG